ncbi:MAG: THUMP domain-containing protein [Candidatus Hodarchaeales archaeon]
MYSCFLISSKAHNERNALSEAYPIIIALSKEKKLNIFAQTLNVKGLGLLSIEEDTITMSDNYHGLIRDYLPDIKYCEKIIPLNGIIKERNASTFLYEKINQYLPVIENDASWKIDIKKRHSPLKDKRIIDSIAPSIQKGSVNLTNPDWLIHINIIKNWIGYGIIKPHFIISLSKEEKKVILT